MTELCSVKASRFFRGHCFESARRVTIDTGIRGLAPNATMDDYVFEPCGYSMNGIESDGVMTIHVTPEDDFSYASVEFCCYDLDMMGNDPQAIVRKILEVFGPNQASVSLSVDGQAKHTWAEAFAVPQGYACKSASLQDLRGGGYVAYFVLGAMHRYAKQLPDNVAAGFHAAMKHEEGGSLAPTKGAAAAAADAVADPTSPRSVLKALPSYGILSSVSLCGADSDGEHSSASDSLASSLMGLTGLSGGAEPYDGGSSNPPSHVPSRSASPRDTTALYQTLAALDAVALGEGSIAELDHFAAGVIHRHGMEDSFYVYDLGVVARLHRAWSAAMPRVTPYYAVKCNTDKGLLRYALCGGKMWPLGDVDDVQHHFGCSIHLCTPHFLSHSTLAALGCGFDCASAAEVDIVKSLGVASDRIVFANACKRPADIRHMANTNVQVSTFDSVCELEKMARWHPTGAALLRIRADDPEARCQLGNKYGCEAYEVRGLLQAAVRLGVNVVGVSFHVGSGATNPCAFSQAIAAARDAWDVALELGFSMQLLDIGGGFAGGTVDGAGLGAVPAAVNEALERFFPATGDEDVRVIAEPGRYFAESMATYHTMVFGTRSRPVGVEDAAGGFERGMIGDGSAGRHMEYWVTDGLYGSMNSVLYDHASLKCRVVKSAGGGEERSVHAASYPSTVFGPTCDGLDTLLRDVDLPELGVGDWLAWPAMGAYTQVGACDFNGIVSTARPVFYVVSGMV